MTPEDARHQWFKEMADRLAPVYTPCDDEPFLCSPTITIEDAARLAAHFGGLALGETALLRFNRDVTEDDIRRTHELAAGLGWKQERDAWRGDQG